MVNNNIQGVIPLEGEGFVAKLKRDYDPGQYRRLSNVEIDSGIIKNRRNIESIHGVGSTAVPMTNSFPFIGFLAEYAIYCSATEQRMTNGSGYTTLWAPTGLTVPAAASSYHKIVGVFRYNNLNCWLTHKFDAGTNVNTINLYYAPDAPFAGGVAAVTLASLTSVVLVTDASYDFVFDNFFIQGERLWIVTSKGIYFSKATDHTVFSLPDGGFFKFQSQKIKFAFALKDTIFVLCDNSVFTINYTADPNKDSYSRQISDVLGGDHGCVHKDTPYFVNFSGLYSISATGVTKVSDNSFDVGSQITYIQKITSFENYLIINRYNNTNYGKSASFFSSFFNNVGRKFAPNSGFNLLGYNLFFVNTDTGSSHVVDISPNTGEYITDIVVNPNKDFFGGFKCFMMTNRYITEDAVSFTYRSNILTMSPSRNFFVFDLLPDASNIVRRYRPAIDIEIDSYAPDGSEYLVKKYRNLEVTATLPNQNFGYALAYDNKNYGAYKNLNIDVGSLSIYGEARGHYPCRIPLNQRARSINIRFKTLDPTLAMGDAETSEQTEISDARVLWTYTGRGNETMTPTTT